jgi:hypothetical protein
MNRRAFLLLPAVAPMDGLVGGLPTPQWLHVDHVIGTSLDIVMWPANRQGEKCAWQAAAAILDEIDRLAGILSTYDPQSEILRS